MEMKEIFGARLKFAREFRKMTQVELGEKANLPSSSIAHFETGTRKPSFDTLRKVSLALDVTTDFLLGTVDEPALVKQADVLFRDMGKLNKNDKELIEDITKLLAKRSQAK